MSKLRFEPAGIFAVVLAAAGVVPQFVDIPTEGVVGVVAAIAAVGAKLVRDRTSTHAFLDQVLEEALELDGVEGDDL